MVLIPRRTLRHPFFRDLAATPAAGANGERVALYGTFGELTLAARTGGRARRAIFVLTRAGELLAEEERDELWRLFQVPVYALLLRGRRVAAWECEAQDGMHLAGGAADHACRCGRPGAKLRAVKASPCFEPATVRYGT